MSKQFIQFAGVLFMLAALLAVSAQENTMALNNATMNNTTLLNNTTLNAIEILPVQNETAPAQNLTQPENVTVAAEPVSAAIPVPVVSRPGAMQIGSPQRNVFAIGGGEGTPSLFPIDGKALAQGAYEVGLPAKTIMDLSALPFFVNKI